MRRELILIRHAESAPDYCVPAEEWGLSEKGRAQAEFLSAAGFWRHVGMLCSSAEPKAIATAVPAARRHGLHVRIMTGLHEVGRPAGRLGDFDGEVREYLAGRAAGYGWEPLERAARRIRLTMADILRDDPAATVAVVSHGTVLALFMCELLGIGNVYRFWKTIPFAGYARIDPEAGVLLQAASA